MNNIRTTALSVLCLFFALCAQSQSSLRLFTTRDGLQTGQVRMLILLPSGEVFAATEGMFYLADGQRFNPLPCRQDSVMSLPQFGSYQQMWQGDSLLWLTDFYSLYIFDARSRRFRYDYSGRTDDKRVAALIEGRYTGGDNQAARPDAVGPLFDSACVSLGIADELVTSCVTDRSGGLWMGTRRSGIIYVPHRKQKVHAIRPLKDDCVLHLQPVPGGESIIAAGSGGIYLLDRRTLAVTRTLARGDINSHGMEVDEDGSVAITTNQGLYIYSDGELRHFNSANTPTMLHNHVRLALPLDDGRVLACLLINYLGYIDPAEHSFTMLGGTNSEAVAAYRTLACAMPIAGHADEVLVCTQNGAFVLNTSTDSIHRFAPLDSEVRAFSNKFNCALTDSRGRLWIGSQNGLLLLRRSTTAARQWQVQRLSEADGLSNSCIQSLAEDPMGHIWVGTSCGINRIRTDVSPETHADELHIRQIGISEGVPEVELIERGVCMLADEGRLIFTSSEGLLTLQADDFSDYSNAPTLHLISMRVAGEERTYDAAPLVLDYGQNYLYLRFSALSYAAPEQTVYRYRLLPTDEQYTTIAAPVADIRLAALPPGTYSLQVQASTGDDVWSNPFTVDFCVEPPLWLTWWAKLIYALFAIAVLVVAMAVYLRSRRKKLESENDERVEQLFEQREEARTNFAESALVDSSKITITTDEDKLMQNLLQSMNDNMDNSEYTVEQLAADVCMSRSNLYRRMQTMLGITPNDFIRTIRLKHAARLLTETDMPVSQIAFSVGFQTPRYFSQCFASQFGLTPTSYRAQKNTPQE